MGPTELIVIFIVLCLLGVLITGIVLWSTSGSGGSGEMSCGACGYAVHGLTQLNCPECGVDLREAGISKGASANRKMTGIVLTLGSLGIFFLFLLLSMPLFTKDVSPSSSPAIQTLPAPSTQSSSSPIENADGSKTIVNRDGSKIIFYPDGSSTLIQIDGTMKTFDTNGAEIPNPEPEGEGTADESTPPAPEVP